MRHRGIAIAAAALAVFAICTDGASKSLDLVTNETLRAYTEGELELGAPSIPVSSRILYREALDLLHEGKKEAATSRLELAASLTGDYAVPLFTLARIEFLSANPAFAVHLAQALGRILTSYPSHAVLAANAVAFALLTLMCALVALLVAFLVKYWRFINHKIIEVYGRRIPFPPARWIVAFACVALAFLRLGLALYAAILIVAVWVFLSRREKGVVLSFVMLIAAASIMARSSNALAPAIDPASVTGRLSLVNQRGVNEQIIAGIRAIPDADFRAEKEFALGTMMYRFGAYDEARRHLLEAVSIRPDYAPAFINLGDVYFLQGDYDKALAGYQNAVELDSMNAVADYNIGQTYIKKMLFAQSGDWLERANILGIDAFRAAHPTLALRNPPVYEQGFATGELWSIAAAEGRGRRSVLVSEMLRPYLLFPFNWLWALFAASLAAAMIAARRLPDAWHVRRCDNCGSPTCACCEDTRTGIRLCRDCAGVISGLNSIKIMEAILRTKRQKLDAGKQKPRPWTLMFFPGVSHIRFDRLFGGVSLLLVASGAVVSLVWRETSFRDPRSVGLVGSLWGALPAVVALAAGYLLALRVKPPQELRSYHVFPAEIRQQEHERDKETEKAREAKPAAPEDPWKKYDHDTATGVSAKRSFDDDPSPAPAAPREKVTIGAIEKGSKWH
jgi:tetratricopeptide (TPR) repeat protein